MKVVILTGGKGEELWPLAKEKTKSMLPLVGKPILQRIIEAFIENGIKNFIIVHNPREKEIQEHFGNGSRWGVQIKYASQEKPRIEGAILAAKPFVENEATFILSHGDIIFDPPFISKLLDTYENMSSDMVAGVALQGEVKEFGVADLTSQGYIKKIITGGKGIGNYVIAGLSLVTPDLFNYLENGETFISATNKMIQDDLQVTAAVWPYTWIDIGRPWDLLHATRFILSSLEKQIIDTKVDISGATIKGPVIIEKGVTIKEGATIRGPVYIGANSYVGNNALIRDYAVLEQNARIGMGVEIKASIIMPNATVHRLSYVGDSILDREATLSAGSITVNTDPTGKTITMNIKGKPFDSGLTKLGSVIGAKARIGVHSTIYPGIKIGRKAIIPHGTTVTEDVPDHDDTR